VFARLKNSVNLTGKRNSHLQTGFNTTQIRLLFSIIHLFEIQIRFVGATIGRPIKFNIALMVIYYGLLKKQRANTVRPYINNPSNLFCRCSRLTA